MSEKEPFIIPAIVAVVAIIGLVMNFQGGSTGLFHDQPKVEFPSATQNEYYAYGARSAEAVMGVQVAPEAANIAWAATPNNQYFECGPACSSLCPGSHVVGLNTVESECNQYCTTVCHDIILEEIMLQFE